MRWNCVFVAPVLLVACAAPRDTDATVRAQHGEAADAGAAVDSGALADVGAAATDAASDAAPDHATAMTFELASGDFHSCALVRPDAVRCWGNNVEAQLGDGNLLDQTEPIDVLGIPAIGPITALVAGGSFSCALNAQGEVYCWGDDAYGQVGSASWNDAMNPSRMPGLSDVQAISAGGVHACAVVRGGQARCWGSNFAGQLGDGSKAAKSAAPVDVANVSGATSVAAGGFFACAIVAGGHVRCWGDGTAGELGNGQMPTTSLAVDVSGITGATAIAAGSKHACALVAGQVSCWGDNARGQLGNGTNDAASTPVVVKNLSQATSIVAHENLTCALDAAGTAYCWGENAQGQLGDGSAVDSANLPVAVLGVTGAVTIAAGFQHACAGLKNGSVLCWGYGGFGQLGWGSTQSSRTPVTVHKLP